MAISNVSQKSANHSYEREFMTIDELSLYIGLSKRAIYQRAAHHTIPSQKIGGLLRFKKSEIDKWLNSHYVVPIHHVAHFCHATAQRHQQSVRSCLATAHPISVSGSFITMLF